MSAKRLVPAAVRRSPQFIASFSNSRLGSVPTELRLAGLPTFHTWRLSMPLVTKIGAVFMKQPEMPAGRGCSQRGEVAALQRGGRPGGGEGRLAQPELVGLGLGRADRADEDARDQGRGRGEREGGRFGVGLIR